MASSKLSGLNVAGICCAVPTSKKTCEDLAATFGEIDAKRLIKSTGVHERRVGNHCASDLCYEAAKKLMADLDWSPTSISHLIFVTQSADYILPASACILQQRLNLPVTCTAFDINLGCSGYTYGLWVVSKLLEIGHRALLLVGDAIHLPPLDRTTTPLFGHAGSATAIEKGREADFPPAFFVMGTDGNGAPHIIKKAGHSRIPSTSETRERVADPNGNIRSQEDVYMNGAEVFSFALDKVPGLVNDVLTLAGWSIDDCRNFVFHQANGFMLKTLADKLKIDHSKVPQSLRHYGNTNSASIPLTLATTCRDQLISERSRVALIGFGIGWSWAAACLEIGPMTIPSLIELD